MRNDDDDDRSWGKLAGKVLRFFDRIVISQDETLEFDLKLFSCLSS